MMTLPETTTHPTDSELLAFSIGQLESNQAAAVEEHIERCDTCCDTLLGLSSEDTLSNLVREVSAGARPGEPAGSQANAEDFSAPEALLNHPRYEIDALVAKGGMGNVFKAVHRVMERPVAIKVIKPSLMERPEAVARFHREVKAAARLTHPHIVTAYDAEQIENDHFLVMEFVDGIDLASLVRSRGPFPVQLACRYVRQAAEGLGYAHRQGMIHRDVKPHNLMVNQDDTVKVLDFGLAHLREASSELAHTAALPQTTDSAADTTTLGQVLGTPDYISPEQCTATGQVDHRTDIYSLGCTLYYLLTGHAPFFAGSPAERLRCHREQQAPSLRSCRDDIPPELDDYVLQMLAKDPDDRPSSCEDVSRRLQPFAAGQREPVRRWPLVATAAAAIAAMLVFGIVLFVDAGRTTIKFEIDDPDLAVRFAGQQIHIDNDGKQVAIKPYTEQRFLVEQNGTVVETDTFKLSKGEKVALRVTIVKGAVAVVPDKAGMKIAATASPVLKAEGSPLLDQLRAATFVDKDSEAVAKELQDKIVGLYFTAAWCGACKSVTPMVQKLRDANSANFEFVVMSLDHDLNSQKKYLQSNQIQAPSLRFDDPLATELMEKYQFGGIPTLLVFSPSGNLITASGAEQIRAILEQPPTLEAQDPADEQAVAVWKTIVQNWQNELKNSHEAKMAQRTTTQGPIFAKYSDLPVAKAVEALGPDPDPEQLQAVLAGFGAKLANNFGQQEQQQLEQFKRLAIELEGTYANSVGPLYYAMAACIHQLGKAAKDQPQIYDVFANWTSINDNSELISRAWGYRGMAACGAAGNPQAIADIQSLNLKQLGGTPLEMFEVLTPLCQQGNQTAIQLVGILYAKDQYWDYLALEAVTEPAKMGQADALRIVREIASGGQREQVRQAAEEVLKNIDSSAE